jgi:hypothetical protein
MGNRSLVISVPSSLAQQTNAGKGCLILEVLDRTQLLTIVGRTALDAGIGPSQSPRLENTQHTPPADLFYILLLSVILYLFLCRDCPTCFFVFTNNTQHKPHAPEGIRIRNLNRRSAVNPRFSVTGIGNFCTYME